MIVTRSLHTAYYAHVLCGLDVYSSTSSTIIAQRQDCENFTALSSYHFWIWQVKNRITIILLAWKWHRTLIIFMGKLWIDQVLFDIYDSWIQNFVYKFQNSHKIWMGYGNTCLYDYMINNIRTKNEATTINSVQQFGKIIK